jgi:homocysteine S-methyltransferase
VDLLIMETFSDLHEISEAVSAAHDHHPGIPIIAQMTFTRDDRTLLGDSPGQVASALARLGVDVIGVNCSNGPAQILRVIKEMQAVRPDQRFSAAPNAGWPEYVHGRVMYAAGPEYFADFADSMRGRGVAVIGGCCGTTPTHIAAMRERLDRPMTAPIQVKGGLRQQEPDEAEGGQKAAPSALALKIAGGEFVVAVEMSPPKGVAGEKEIRAGLLMKEAGADVIDVLDSPMARMRMSPWALCYLLEQRVGIESVLHFPTRGRNLLRVQGDLLAAHALGVRNLFVVMGDPTHIGDYPDAADNYDIVPSGLIKLIKENLNQGIDSAGNNIGEPTNFLVSAALNVNAPDLDKQIGVLRKKIEAGVDYVITQPIYDGGLIERFLERYAVLHGPLEVPVLVGLLPLNSLKNAVFLHNEVPGITVPDPFMARMDRAAGNSAEEGARIARELADHLRPLLGGVYLLPQFRRYDLIADIVEHLREPVAG